MTKLKIKKRYFVSGLADEAMLHPRHEPGGQGKMIDTSVASHFCTSVTSYLSQFLCFPLSWFTLSFFGGALPPVASEKGYM